MNEEYMNEEVVVDQASQDLVDQLDQPVEEAPAPAQQVAKKDNSAERNFRELREKTERLERERNELARRMEQIEQRNQQPVADPEPEFNFGDDDLVEGKVIKKIAQRFEKKLEDYQRQQQVITTEAMLKSKYQDFDAVVNESTINKLREKYPEVAASLYAYQDPYGKLSGAYKLIKDLNIYDPNADQYEEDRATVQRNAKQPRAAATMAPQTGTTPLSQANDYAKRYNASMADKIRAEVEDIIRR